MSTKSESWTCVQSLGLLGVSSPSAAVVWSLKKFTPIDFLSLSYCSYSASNLAHASSKSS